MRKTATLAAALAIVFAVYAAAPSWGAGAKPGRTETCKETNQQEIAALFVRWNNSLHSGNASRVVADNYAEGSVLLPTVSDTPRVTVAEKEDYFRHFLQDGPVGRIDWRVIVIGCNSAVDTGLYTFIFLTGARVPARYTFTYKWDGRQWLITSHHSSRMPEDCLQWRPTKK